MMRTSFSEMLQNPVCDRPEKNGKTIPQRAAGRIGNQIRDVCGPGAADEGLKQLDA